MVGGQMLDLLAEQEDGQTLDDIMLIQSLKTGALFGFSLESGALLAGVDGDDRQVLRTYADKVGLAFQIADDILDVESTPEALGKQTQKDAHAGKATFIDLYGLEGARSKANELVDEAVTAVERYGNKAIHLQAAARYVVNRKT